MQADEQADPRAASSAHHPAILASRSRYFCPLIFAGASCVFISKNPLSCVCLTSAQREGYRGPSPARPAHGEGLGS